jgi:hypothetical protein
VIVAATMPDHIRILDHTRFLDSNSFDAHRSREPGTNGSRAVNLQCSEVPQPSSRRTGTT